MSPEMAFVLLKGMLGFGVPLAWGFWELYQLRLERLKDEAKAQAAASSPATTAEEAAVEVALPERRAA